MKLGNHLRRFRFEHGEITQEALATAVGVSRQTVIAVEKGRFVPSTILALRLSRFFGKSVDEVFYLIDDSAAGGRDGA